VNEAPPPARDGGEAAVDTVPSARRPTRRYYLERTAERCELYATDSAETTPRASTPCPPDLESGERIRIAGKTCVREGPGGAAREQPVVCPDPLTHLEQKERGDRK
jgi:hypothetical protein